MKRKVIGIGETVLDIIFKDGKPLNAVPGGSTFNAMISLGRSGIPTTFLSEAGDDRIGEFVIDFLRNNGVDADKVSVYPGMKSPLSLAFLDKDNIPDYVFYKDNKVTVPEFNYPDIQPDDIVLFGSYYAINPEKRTVVNDFLNFARERGAILYYDVNFRSSHRNDIMKITPNLIDNLEFADIVRGSDEDFDIIYKKSDPDLVYKAEISFYCKTFICTCGSNPVVVHSANDYRNEYPITKAETVSTIGAGDNFNAGFIYGMIKNNITRNDIERGLTETEFNSLIESAQMFASECCKDIYNYVSPEFGNKNKL